MEFLIWKSLYYLTEPYFKVLWIQIQTSTKEREKKLCIKSFCSVSYPSLCNFVTVLVKKFFKFRDFQPKIVKSRKNYRHNLQNYDVQGDPKQKLIFESDCTWLKNDFLGANWKFLLIWVWQYLLYLMALHFFDVLLKYRV